MKTEKERADLHLVWGFEHKSPQMVMVDLIVLNRDEQREIEEYYRQFEKDE